MRKINNEERIAKFPKDRIPFLPSANAVHNDKFVFQKYKEKRIGLGLACRMMAENNGLAWVTIEQFLNEYDICGWNHAMTEEEEETRAQYERDHSQ